MNIWEKHRKQEGKLYKNNIYLHFNKGIEPNLKMLFRAFISWLRKKYSIPTRINVYIIDAEKIKLANGHMAYGGFRWYPKRSPRIRIAAKVEIELFEGYEHDEIYNMILSSLVHELTHYYQWVDNIEQDDSVSERQANYFRYRIIDKFLDETGFSI